MVPARAAGCGSSRGGCATSTGGSGNDASELLFVYGENDPWSAEPFHLGQGTRDSYCYTAPGANHGANIAQLEPAEQAAATATVLRWAGLAAAPAARVAAPRVAALDSYNEALDRRLP